MGRVWVVATVALAATACSDRASGSGAGSGSSGESGSTGGTVSGGDGSASTGGHGSSDDGGDSGPACPNDVEPGQTVWRIPLPSPNEGDCADDVACRLVHPQLVVGEGQREPGGEFEPNLPFVVAVVTADDITPEAAWMGQLAPEDGFVERTSSFSSWTYFDHEPSGVRGRASIRSGYNPELAIPATSAAGDASFVKVLFGTLAPLPLGDGPADFRLEDFASQSIIETDVVIADVVVGGRGGRTSALAMDGEQIAWEQDLGADTDGAAVVVHDTTDVSVTIAGADAQPARYVRLAGLDGSVIVDAELPFSSPALAATRGEKVSVSGWETQGEKVALKLVGVALAGETDWEWMGVPSESPSPTVPLSADAAGQTTAAWLRTTEGTPCLVVVRIDDRGELLRAVGLAEGSVSDIVVAPDGVTYVAGDNFVARVDL